MGRKDKDEFLKETSFGFIPAGTSNGLIHSILKHNNENSDYFTAAFRICKGRSMKMDITELEMEFEQEKKYSILSVVWSIIASCDLDSEGLRFLGEARYTLMGAWRWLILKQYFGHL